MTIEPIDLCFRKKMLEKVKKLIEKHHLLIVGKSAVERHRFITDMDVRYKGEGLVRLIISQALESQLLEDLSKKVYCQSGERRTKMQIVQQNLKVLEL